MTRTTTQRTANRGSRARASQPNNGAARPTREQRVAMGKAARREVPGKATRSSPPTADRPDPVALLESQGSARVPELVPIRYGRMAVSPFTFFRGAALPMAERPRHHAAHRASRAGLRRRPPGQLRHVRLAGAAGSSSTSTTSTRRCPGRGSGTSSAWRPAWRSPRRDNGLPRRSAHRIVLRRGRRVPQGDARVRRAWRPATSGTRTSTRTSIKRRGSAWR